LSHHQSSPEAEASSSSLHPDCPPWLPQHISQIQLSYTVAEQLPGLPGAALLGQRVAFVLLEEFQQHDSRKEIDTLLAGLHTGQVVQAIGQGHQPDMCQPSCTAQHHFFYVRVCPTHSQTVKPGSKRKRRLDLKMDLSSANAKGSFQELMQLDKAQLEDAWLLVAPLANALSPKPSAEHAREIATTPVLLSYAKTCHPKRDTTPPTQPAKRCQRHGSTQSAVELTDKGRGRGRNSGMGRGRSRDRGRGGGRGSCKHRAQTGNLQETDAGSMIQDASAAEEDCGIVGSELSASNACNGGKQSHHRVTHAGQVLGSCVSPDLPLQPNSNQSPAATLPAAKAAADIPPSTWQQGCVVWVPFGAAHWPAKLISCSQGSHNHATVELFGTGLKTEVAASGLTTFADGCADKCQQLHSELGRQAVRLAHTAQTAAEN
ncbi:TPA: hypothetical protein ACH3X2_011643, partial [Trebouxia sp. C0005]